jgi:hypothetical protein
MEHQKINKIAVVALVFGLIAISQSPGSDNTKVNRSGDTMSGNLYFDNNFSNIGIDNDNKILIYNSEGTQSISMFIGGKNLLQLNNTNNQDDSVTLPRLTGSGNAYACLDTKGKIFRSNTQC